MKNSQKIYVTSVLIVVLLVLIIAVLVYVFKSTKDIVPATNSAAINIPFKIGDTAGDFTVVSAKLTHGGYSVEFTGTTTVFGQFLYGEEVGTVFIVGPDQLPQIPHDPTYKTLSFCVINAPKNVDYSKKYTIIISGFHLLDAPIDGCNDSTFVNIVEPVATPAATTTVAQQYSDLFVAKRENMTSNIVGYFGYGAFAWYVPDWLITKWKMSSHDNGSMTFTPQVRNNPDDFSDITFTIATSTELFNANNLYQSKLDAVSKSDLVSNEVLLNKNEDDMIKLQLETDTRIYHVIYKDTDGIHTIDTYFIDGNGKTVVITFKAKSEIFSQFTDKIRDMVEGIGEAKSPQG